MTKYLVKPAQSATTKWHQDIAPLWQILVELQVTVPDHRLPFSTAEIIRKSLKLIAVKSEGNLLIIDGFQSPNLDADNLADHTIVIQTKWPTEAEIRDIWLRSLGTYFCFLDPRYAHHNYQVLATHLPSEICLALFDQKKLTRKRFCEMLNVDPSTLARQKSKQAHLTCHATPIVTRQ